MRTLRLIAFLVLLLVARGDAQIENQTVYFFYNGGSWTGRFDGVKYQVTLNFPSDGRADGDYAFYYRTVSGGTWGVVVGASRKYINGTPRVNVGGTWVVNNTQIANYTYDHNVHGTNGAYVQFGWQNFVGNVGGAASAITAEGGHFIQRQNPQGAGGANTYQQYYQTFTHGGAVPPKPPETLFFTLINAGPQSVVYRLVDPTGDVASEGYVGPGGTGDITYTPLSTDPAGNWTLQAVTWSGTSIDPIPLGAWNFTLSETPADPEFSRSWSGNGGTGTVAGEGEPGEGPGSVQNLSGGPVTTNWKDPLGNTIGPGPTFQNGTNQLVDTSGLPAIPTGTSQQFQLVDASTGQLINTVTVTNPGDGLAPIYSGSGHTILRPPATNPTPDDQQTNQGDQPNGVTSTNPNVPSTGATNVNNGGTTISGTGTGATVQDLYGAVKNAVQDAKFSGTMVNSPGPTLEPLETEPGDWEDITGKVSEIGDDIQTAPGLLAGKLPTLDGLNTTFGSVNTLSFGTLPVLNVDLVLNLDSGLGTIVGLVRTAFLYGLAVVWVVEIGRLVRGYL